jgi:hypothetical protein
MTRVALAFAIASLAVTFGALGACIDDSTPTPPPLTPPVVVFDGSIPESSAPADRTPPDTTLTVTPKTLSNDATPTFVFASTQPGTFACQVDDAAPAACTSPHAVPVKEGAHKFEVVAISSQGVRDESPASFAWTVDLTPPDTTISKAPAALDNSATTSFEFSSNETGTFACAFDGAAASECTSPYELKGLTDGTHTLTIVATDSAGNADPTPATHSWVIDTSIPDTTIASGPTGFVSSTSATLTFSSPNAGASATFTCSLDGAPFAPCTSPKSFTGLAQGAHKFRVAVSDTSGNTDPTPAERSWTVDTLAPTVSVTGGPAGPTNDTTPTFTFTTSGATTVECRIGPAGTFAACTSPFTPGALTTGSYTFEVRAKDQANNAATATRAFSIDVTAPTVSFTGGPNGPTNDSTPTFTFTASGGATATQCRLTTGTFAACTSPYSPAGPLADGSYAVEVKAIDAANNSATASRSFSIDTVAPTSVAVTNGPTYTASTPGTFTFTATGATSTSCRIYPAGNPSGAYVSCASPYDAALQFVYPSADWTFEVLAVDDAGNATSAFWNFTTYVIG